MGGVDHLHSRYEVGGVFLSSVGRGWRGISAELRSHSVGEIPGYEPTLTEIGVQIRGNTVVTRRGHGVEQRIIGRPGTIGLVPVGVREDFAHVAKFVEEILHIYLSLDSFVTLTKEMSRDFAPGAIRYDAGFQDPLIERIALELVDELRHETSCGDLLAETLADSLAARLLNNYSTWSGAPSQITRHPKGLGPRRLSRVLNYVESNLTQDITVDQLAAVAALSRFHFSRMFKVATGYPPSRFIGRRRLELAKSLLAEGGSIADIAQLCRFSTDSNFARAFRRATGLTPAQYQYRRSR
jgi:AraC family transcriptional regulator